jgi:hypothetical protein
MAIRTVSAMRGAGVFGAAAALAFCLVTTSALAESASPFTKLAGAWAGSGTIELADGTHEPIRCKAAYDVLGEDKNLQLNIRCASDSYNFEMIASAKLDSNAISGNWTEATRNVAGKISGTASGDRIDVVAESAAFSASLALTTHGDRQSVVIKSREAKTTVKGATISLQRS